MLFKPQGTTNVSYIGDWRVGLFAIVPSIILCVATRRLLLVPVFHVTEMFWSNALMLVIYYNFTCQVIGNYLTARAEARR